MDSPSVKRRKTGDLENADTSEPQISARKVLVLYTGGTIGMKDRGNGYEAVPHYFESSLRENALFHDIHHPNQVNGALVLPQTEPLITYEIIEYTPILDSCDMGAKDYCRIANDIARNYKKYHGFIVLHGTDTLAYTASVLSFLLNNLGKTIVITGSQIPIFELRSDGRDNLLGALQMAGHYTVPEVTVYFDNKLYRGNRVTKVSCVEFNAFMSPNYAALAEHGININVNWQLVLKPQEIEPFSVCAKLSSNVSILRLFPALTSRTFAAYLADPIEGVVLQSYGSGNVPIMQTEMQLVIKEAVDRGVIIVNITQCQRGSVMGLYATGQQLYNIGVCPGHDMTAEAAVAKLMYVCAQPWSKEEKVKAMQRSMRGELSDPALRSNHTRLNEHLLSQLTSAFGLSSASEATKIRDELLPALMAAAIKQGDMDYLADLGKLAGHFQIIDSQGRTPLHYAALHNNSECCKLLLSNGSLVNREDSEGYTPLWVAMQRGNMAAIAVLQAAGANIASVSASTIGAQLCSRASSGDAKAISGFLAAGVSPDVADYDGRRALHLAVHYKQLEIVALLMQHGADVHVKDHFGRSVIDEFHCLVCSDEFRRQMKCLLLG